MEQFKTEFKSINSKQILVDEDYQRPVDYARVKKIVANFNPNLVNPIKVSFRNRKYYCFDGQHTLSALKARNENNNLTVDCKVYYGMAKEDEAKLFAEQNGISKGIISQQKMKSLYVSKDIDVIDFKKTVESCGFKCDFGSAGGSKRLACYSTAFQIYKRHGALHLINVLNVSMDAWGGLPESVSQEIVIGLDMFIRAYADEYNRKHLVKRLSLVSPSVVRSEMRSKKFGGNKRYAATIYDIYCKGTSTKRLEYKF